MHIFSDSVELSSDSLLSVAWECFLWPFLALSCHCHVPIPDSHPFTLEPDDSFLVVFHLPPFFSSYQLCTVTKLAWKLSVATYGLQDEVRTGYSDIQNAAQMNCVSLHFYLWHPGINCSVVARASLCQRPDSLATPLSFIHSPLLPTNSHWMWQELLWDCLSQEVFGNHFWAMYAYLIVIWTPSIYCLFQLFQPLIKYCFHFVPLFIW